MTNTELVGNLTYPTEFNRKYKGIYDAFQGVVVGKEIEDYTPLPDEEYPDHSTYHIIVLDVVKRGDIGLKEILLNRKHPALFLYSNTDNIEMHKAVIDLLNKL